MTITVSEIMTTDVVTLSPSNTLKEAHEITRRMGIRHLPIVSPESNQLVAVITQRTMLTKLVSIVANKGTSKLAEHENKTSVMELALSDFEWVTPKTNVADVAPYFLQNKLGCMPVIDEDKQLIGIITSSDFVKLAVKLLGGTR